MFKRLNEMMSRFSGEFARSRGGPENRRRRRKRYINVKNFSNGSETPYQ